MTICVKIDENTNTVSEIIACESVKWCKKNIGGNWVKIEDERSKITLNDIYYPESGRFSKPQPFPSWSMDPETFLWEPPTPRPSDYYENGKYDWNEETQTWDEIPK